MGNIAGIFLGRHTSVILNQNDGMCENLHDVIWENHGMLSRSCVFICVSRLLHMCMCGMTDPCVSQRFIFVFVEENLEDAICTAPSHVWHG